MRTFKLIKNYKNINHYRRSFTELANLVFGIDFEGWFQKGGWNDRYICYSYVSEGKVVANVSISKMDLLWEGERKKALQVGTVMIHPDYRGLGLATELMQEVLREGERNYSCVYLFTGEETAGFYARFGFLPLKESRFALDFEGGEKTAQDLEKLDMEKKEDFQTVFRLTASRTPVSPLLGVSRDQHLLLFYCLGAFSQDLYYWREEDALILFRREGPLLHLYDVIAENPPPLPGLLNRILPPGPVTVVFHFTPDLEGVKREPSQDRDNILLIKPKPRGLTRDFQFPATSRA